jgi:hypothetical protein
LNQWWVIKNRIGGKKSILKKGLGLWPLTPLFNNISVACIMALKFYWWRKSEYPEKTINLANLQQVTYSCIDYS